MSDRPCTCCYDTEFDDKKARDRVRDYRRNGPPPATRILADELGRDGVADRTVLDIGAGVGALHHLLLERGAASVLDVDASRPYIEVARGEAERRGFGDRVRFEHGDAVVLADQIEPADLVALDRSACCYHDISALVGLAGRRARLTLGLVLPRDIALIRFGIRVLNVGQRLRRSEFRVYAHAHSAVDGAARSAGLVPLARRNSGIWTILVYARPEGPSTSSSTSIST
ncbi:MAG: class I SAM-dependent methyltransferase [Chloroflexota bacterium]